MAVVERYSGVAGSTVYEIDLASGTIATYALAGTSGPFYDVEFLADGKLLLSQQSIGNGSTPLRVLDPESGTFTNVFAPDMPKATLTGSADHSHVFLEPFGYAQASYLYVSGTGIVAQVSTGPSDPYAGASLPPSDPTSQATAPDGSLYVQGRTLNVYDSSLHLVTSLGANFPYFTGTPGLAFSPDGQKLFVVVGSMVVVFNTTTWDTIGAYSIGDLPANPHDSISISGTDTGYGDILQVSGDGRHLALIGSQGIQLINLDVAVFDTTQGGDTVSGTGAIFGLGGNDELSGAGSFAWMYGGKGDDTYHVNNSSYTAFELANQGHDTVHSTIDYTLGSNIEDLVLEGSAVRGSGNDLDNLIVGTGGNNELGGAGGNDELRGYAGDDKLDGGIGNDILDGGDGNDTVTYLSSLVGVTVDLGRGGAQDTGAGTDLLLSIENLIGTWYNDQLTGDAGANRLEGFVGDDVLSGGLGADVLVGGDGSDTFRDSAAGLNGDTLADFAGADKIIISDADPNTFAYSVIGNVLNYSGGSLTFGTAPGRLYVTAAVGGGVQIQSIPPVATVDQLAYQLTTGFWSGDSHRWAVSQGDSLTVNFGALTADESALARSALQTWTDVIGIRFLAVTSGGQIVFDHSEDAAGPVAETAANWSDGVITSAHVHVSTSWLTAFGSTIGSYGYQTYVHEIGHALGLGHPGDYNDIATYSNNAIFSNDGWPLSVMSYFDQVESTYFSQQHFTNLNAATPMLADIVAMQNLYGLSQTARLGDTVYGHNSNAGGIYDAGSNLPIALTIFDSGGIDTLDYSNFVGTQLINLHEESFSNVDGRIGNVAIARGVTIENAIGGFGFDTIIGNSADNVLTGNAGHDVLTGGAGNDTFRDTAAGHNGDTITDFELGDRIVITDATLNGFSFSFSGDVLIYTGGSLTLGGLHNHSAWAAQALEGGVQITISATAPVVISPYVVPPSEVDGLFGIA
ncbi:MAG: M10 family metallopeptidase C-terminal domain-containing protein [Sphingomicrobium sp.]